MYKYPVVLQCYLREKSADLQFLCQDGAVTADGIDAVARQLEHLVEMLSVEGGLLSGVLDETL